MSDQSHPRAFNPTAPTPLDNLLSKDLDKTPAYDTSTADLYPEDITAPIPKEDEEKRFDEVTTEVGSFLNPIVVERPSADQDEEDPSDDLGFDRPLFSTTDVSRQGPIHDVKTSESLEIESASSQGEETRKLRKQKSNPAKPPSQSDEKTTSDVDTKLSDPEEQIPTTNWAYKEQDQAISPSVIIPIAISPPQADSTAHSLSSTVSESSSSISAAETSSSNAKRLPSTSLGFASCQEPPLSALSSTPNLDSISTPTQDKPSRNEVFSKNDNSALPWLTHTSSWSKQGLASTFVKTAPTRAINSAIHRKALFLWSSLLFVLSCAAITLWTFIITEHGREKPSTTLINSAERSTHSEHQMSSALTLRTSSKKILSTITAQHLGAYVIFARLYMNQGAYGAAHELFLRIHTLYPMNPEAIIGLAQSGVELNREKDLEPLRQSSLPKFKRLFTILRIRLLIKKRQWHKAATLFKSLPLFERKRPQMRLWAGQIDQALGNLEKARLNLLDLMQSEATLSYAQRIEGYLTLSEILLARHYRTASYAYARKASHALGAAAIGDFQKRIKNQLERCRNALAQR